MTDWKVLLAGSEKIPAREGRGLELRLLSAWEVLEARREAQKLTGGETEKALCSNACLLAHALEREGSPVFPDGEAVLEGLSVEQIGSLARQWAEFNRRENPSPEEGARTEALKKAWSTRLISAFSGACSAHFRRCQRRSGPDR